MSDLKGLAKNVPPELQDEYTEYWVAFDERSNQMLGEVEGANAKGEDSILWAWRCRKHLFSPTRGQQYPPDTV